TGTLGAGRLAVGDELELAPAMRRVRVRGLETLKRGTDAVAAVARVAVNLRGLEHGEVHRGDALLTPASYATTTLLDVRLSGAAGPGRRARPQGDRLAPSAGRARRAVGRRAPAPRRRRGRRLARLARALARARRRTARRRRPARGGPPARARPAEGGGQAGARP